MARAHDSIRDFPGKRWLNLVLRGGHLIGIVLLGAGLLGSGHTALGASITFASGFAMFAIDTWANPAHLRETAGFGVLVKLLLVGVIMLDASYALAIFWALLLLSTLLSHAPGNFRHRRLF